jgi:hypothetical protein
MDRVNETADLIKADRRFLISQTREAVASAEVSSCALPHFLGMLAG